MAYDAGQLLEMTGPQLDELFGSSPAGAIPNGPAKGTAIIAPGTKFSAEIAELIDVFGWQGKRLMPRVVCCAIGFCPLG
jgi:hypothetical protein